LQVLRLTAQKECTNQLLNTRRIKPPEVFAIQCGDKKMPSEAF
jgi:hypothetical protein